MRVMVGGGEGRHIEGATDMAVADLTDTHFFMDRGSGVMLSGVQAGIGNPLSYVTVGRNQGQLAQQLQGADRSDARSALQQEKAALERVVCSNDFVRFPAEFGDGRLQRSDAPAQVTHDQGQRGLRRSDGMQTVLFHGALLGKGMDPATQRGHLQGCQARRLPGMKGHPCGILQQHQGIQRIGLAAMHQGPREVFHRPRIGHHHLDPRVGLQQQGNIQTVQASRFQTHAHPSSLAGKIAFQFLMTAFGVGKRARRFALSIAANHHHQLLGADIYTTQIGLVHDFLQALGWFRLPDPAPSPAELVIQAVACDAADSPQPWRGGRGAYLKLRLPTKKSGLAPDRPSPEHGALCTMPLYHKSNIQATEGSFWAERC